MRQDERSGQPLVWTGWRLPHRRRLQARPRGRRWQLGQLVATCNSWLATCNSFLVTRNVQLVTRILQRTTCNSPLVGGHDAVAQRRGLRSARGPCGDRRQRCAAGGHALYKACDARSTVSARGVADTAGTAGTNGTLGNETRKAGGKNGMRSNLAGALSRRRSRGGGLY